MYYHVRDNADRDQRDGVNYDNCKINITHFFWVWWSVVEKNNCSIFFTVPTTLPIQSKMTTFAFVVHLPNSKQLLFASTDVLGPVPSFDIAKKIKYVPMQNYVQLLVNDFPDEWLTTLFNDNMPFDCKMILLDSAIVDEDIVYTDKTWFDTFVHVYP